MAQGYANRQVLGGFRLQPEECRWLFRLKAEATGFAYFSLAMNFTDTGEATLSIWPVGVSRPVCWSIW